jgi:CheY-like chemotaxis protein
MKTKHRVLLVDDEVGLASLLRRSLEAIGDYEVRTANSGSAALALMRQFHPDIVLLDVVMPGMTGRDVAACMRRDPEQARIPIVFVTALPPPNSGSGAPGALDGCLCIEKPLSTDEIVTAIESTLRLRPEPKLEGL